MASGMFSGPSGLYGQTINYVRNGRVIRTYVNPNPRSLNFPSVMPSGKLDPVVDYNAASLQDPNFLEMPFRNGGVGAAQPPGPPLPPQPEMTVRPPYIPIPDVQGPPPSSNGTEYEPAQWTPTSAPTSDPSTSTAAPSGVTSFPSGASIPSSMFPLLPTIVGPPALSGTNAPVSGVSSMPELGYMGGDDPSARNAYSAEIDRDRPFADTLPPVRVAVPGSDMSVHYPSVGELPAPGGYNPQPWALPPGVPVRAGSEPNSSRSSIQFGEDVRGPPPSLYFGPATMLMGPSAYGRSRTSGAIDRLGPDPRAHMINNASVVGSVVAHAEAAAHEGPFETAHDATAAIPPVQDEEIGGMNAADAAEDQARFEHPDEVHSARQAESVVQQVELMRNRSVTEFANAAGGAQAGVPPASLPYHLDMPGPGSSVIRDYQEQIRNWPQVEVGWNPGELLPFLGTRPSAPGKQWPDRKHTRDYETKERGLGSLFDYSLQYPGDVIHKRRRREEHESLEMQPEPEDEEWFDAPAIEPQEAPPPAPARAKRTRKAPQRLGHRATPSEVRAAIGSSSSSSGGVGPVRRGKGKKGKGKGKK